MFLFFLENKLRNPILFFAAMKQFPVTGRTFKNAALNGGSNHVHCLLFLKGRSAGDMYIFQIYRIIL